MGGSLPQFDSNQPHAAFAFGYTEPALHLYTVTFIPVVLHSISYLALFRTSRCRIGQPDAAFLAIGKILPIPVDLICQNAAGVVSLPFAKTLCHCLKIPRLAVGIKGAELQPCPSIHNADIQLCAELHRLAGFSPHDRTNERLADVDDPVGNAVGMVVVLKFLLFIDGADGVQMLRLTCVQKFSTR